MYFRKYFVGIMIRPMLPALIHEKELNIPPKKTLLRSTKNIYVVILTNDLCVESCHQMVVVTRKQDETEIHGVR